MLEAFTGWESANKYRVFNSLGQDVFYAMEDNDCCTRMCCGSSRPFEMNIVDNLGKEVIHLGNEILQTATMSKVLISFSYELF